MASKRKFVPCDFVERCPLCRAKMAGCIGIGVEATWVCPTHGRMTRMEQERIPYYKQTTSMGDCVVVECIEVVDNYPEVIATGLPVWLKEEMQLMRNLTEKERRGAWQARVLAMAQEREMRLRDGSRTVYGSMDGK